MKPSDWTQRYFTKNTKWDLGGSPRELSDFINGMDRPLNVLIPGCGRGYEVAEFIRAGHQVTAVDFSNGAIEAARNTIGEAAEGILFGDFFHVPLPEGSFDLCYERTFFTSLSLPIRELYAPRIASLLKPAGLLIGIFHYGTDDEDGPPFPVTPKDRDRLFAPYFAPLKDSSCPSGLDVFADHDERWQVWRKL